MSLRANFVYTILGNGVYVGCQWAMLSVLAKLGTVDMVGQFTLGLAITAPIMLLASLALRAVLATDTQRQYALSDYVGLRVVTTTVGFAVVLAVVLSCDYSADTRVVVLTLGMAKAVESLSDVLYGRMQQYERMDLIAISMIARGVISLAALTAAVYVWHSVVAATVMVAVAWFVVLVGFDVWAAVFLVHRQHVVALAVLADGHCFASAPPRSLWNWSRLQDLFRLSFPLGITLGLTSLNVNIPRYFVERYSGVTALGVFGAMAYLTTVGTFILNALGQSASPRLAKYYARGDGPQYRRTLALMLSMSALIGFLGMGVVKLGGRQLITILYQEEFASHLEVLAVLMIGAAVTYVASSLGYSLTAMRRFSVQPLILGGTTAVTVLVCLLLIPTYGMLGAAWATVVGSSVQLGASAIYNARALAKLR